MTDDPRSPEPPPRSRSGALASGRREVYRRLLAYVRPHAGRVAAASVAALAAAAAASAYAYLLGPLIEAVLLDRPVTLARRAFSAAELRWALPLAVMAVATVKALGQLLQSTWMQRVGQRVVAALRRDLYARLLQLPPRFFATRHSGELLSRFTADVAQVEFAVAQALSSYVKDGLQALGLLLFCLVLDPKLFLITFILLPGSIIPVSRFARAVRKLATRSQASLARITELSAETLHNLPVVQAFRAEQALLAELDAEQERYLGAMRRSLFVRGAFSPTLEMLGVAGVAAAIAVGTRAVAANPALATKLLQFLGAALLLYQPLKSLSGTFSLVVQGLAAAERLFEVTDHPGERDTGAPAAPLARALELQDVWAQYPDTEHPVLQGVTLTLRAGQKVALVGPSGGGKTTLVSLLLGFLAPSRGEVLWDGTSLAALSLRSLRGQVAWVPQEPVLFSGSVRQNLWVGRANATDEELWEALRRAHAQDFVRALPAGLEEEVGERGARLSGGQRQRLAIARAFLRRPSLLLLDEPTSALDAASEQEVQAGLTELMGSTTALVIAHRLATVRDADLIAVLDGGRIVEAGTHAELLARSGRYAALLAQLAPEDGRAARSA